ncbi:MAG TPA: hypothetical protein VLA97_16055 [Nocardioidaceae bacterium]|nr:hypothetical protein [Nocardioidaceae bacterium]
MLIDETVEKKGFCTRNPLSQAGFVADSATRFEVRNRLTGRPTCTGPAPAGVGECPA